MGESINIGVETSIVSKLATLQSLVWSLILLMLMMQE